MKLISWNVNVHYKIKFVMNTIKDMDNSFWKQTGSNFLSCWYDKGYEE